MTSAGDETEEAMDRSFPLGFVWGAATSAYQIEGAAHALGKGESIWDRFVRIPGAIAEGSTGDVAIDHLSRRRRDVSLMARLGLGAYRFSVAWTRVLPAGHGAVNQRGLDVYDRLIDDLLAAGIEPWPTLYHWDLPQALEDRGGWPSRETVGAFAEFADVVSRRLGDRVSRWITVNEPWEIGFMGYGLGQFAPGRRDLGDALAAIHTVLLAHGQGVAVLRANRPDARVGVAVDLVACYPDTDSPDDAAAAVRMDGHFNRWFLDPLAGRGYPEDMVARYGAAAPDVRPGDLELIATPIEFFGLNYYYSNWIREAKGTTVIERALGAEVAGPHTPNCTGLGWAVHADGFEESLGRIAAMDRWPEIVVTECGAAYPDRATADGRIDDVDRLRYHELYLEATRRSIGRGAPVTGYFAWSLFDNFEWSQGYGPRFGLVKVDYATQRRTIKASGDWYRRVIAANALVPAG